MEQTLPKTDLLERAIYSQICRHDGIKARKIEKLADPTSQHRINQFLFGKENRSLFSA